MTKIRHLISDLFSGPVTSLILKHQLDEVEVFVGDNSTSLSRFAVADLYGNLDTQLLTYGQIIGDEAYRKRNLSFFPISIKRWVLHRLGHNFNKRDCYRNNWHFHSLIWLLFMLDRLREPWSLQIPSIPRKMARDFVRPWKVSVSYRFLSADIYNVFFLLYV